MVDLTANQREYLASLVRMDRRKKERGQKALRATWGDAYDDTHYLQDVAFRDELLRVLKGDEE